MSSNAEERQGPGSGPTVKLSTWVSLMALDDVPDEICVRAKYLILDGIRCGLVGAHLPWSEKAANVMFDMESAGGDTTVFGWERKITPLSAALLNSAFIQAFELDDWHSEAPLHSNSILLPSLFAAAQHLNTRDKSMSISGADFLLATIVGYEAGPRVGNDVWGTNILTQGWHSGAELGPAETEDAFGIAYPQACGLMSAQFGAEVKRMQHGFATMYKRAKARIIRKISAIMLPGGLKKFINTETFADVTVAYDDQHLKAHKIVLCSESAFFEKAFMGNFKEAHDKLINLSEGNEPVHIKAMLQFIYGARYSTMITDDESPEAFITKKPKFHAVVYGKGDKYDVNNLQSYAKTEFTTLLSDALPTAFIPAIPTVYAEALTHDKTLLNRSDKTTVIFSCCQTSYHPADLWEKAILLNEDGDPEKWPHACYSTR